MKQESSQLSRALVQLLVLTCLFQANILFAAEDIVFYVKSKKTVHRTDQTSAIVSFDGAMNLNVGAIAVHSMAQDIFVGYEKDDEDNNLVTFIDRYTFAGDKLTALGISDVCDPSFSITSLAVNDFTNKLYAVCSSGTAGVLLEIDLSDVPLKKKIIAGEDSSIIGLNSVTVEPKVGGEIYYNRIVGGVIPSEIFAHNSNQRKLSYLYEVFALAFVPSLSEIVFLYQVGVNENNVSRTIGSNSAGIVNGALDRSIPNLAVKGSDSTGFAVSANGKAIYSFSIPESSTATVDASEFFCVADDCDNANLTPDTITALAVYDGGGVNTPTVSTCETVDTDGDGLSECDGDKCPTNGNRILESHCKASNGDRCGIDIVYDEPIAISCKATIECPGVRELIGACNDCALPYVPEGGDTTQCVPCDDEAKQVVNGQCVCIEEDDEGECIDLCPGNEKIRPTSPCGCGPDTDSDGDGVLDCEDECPQRALLSVRNETCGCDIEGTDKFGNTICGDKATVPVDDEDLANKTIVNPNTGNPLVPEPPAVTFKEKCSKKKGCKAKFIFASYNVSIDKGQAAARRGKNRRKSKVKYQTTLTNLSSKKGKSKKRLSNKNKLSLGKLKPGSSYSVNYKVVLKGNSGKTRASSASSKTITFRTPGS